MAFRGKNGSGKSSILKAILGDHRLFKSGEWSTPTHGEIGYLDQHYKNLDPQKSVDENLTFAEPGWSPSDRRRHLNDFLFRKTEEVDVLVKHLSGGEKARLSLALIAAHPPRLLILDEITNNLDLETIEHIRQVLIPYPGALLMVSHDEAFLESLKIDQFYEIRDGRVVRVSSEISS